MCMIYRLILAIRNARYAKGRRSVKAPVPTICVGNVTVGGTGKTPHTELLLRLLGQTSRWGGSNLAVLSRGYGRRSRGFQHVTTDGTAAFCGDEPLQIKRNFPSVTVAVDKDRVHGCRILCNPALALEAKGRKKCVSPDFPPADIILLDDAFQYRKLSATLNIVLTSYHRPVTEDTLLPFGRLRDLPSRLYDADIIIVSKCPGGLDDEDKAEFATRLGFENYDPSACTATRKGRTLKLLFSTIAYRRGMPVFESADSRYLYSGKLILFTGIADDTPLYDQLSGSYAIVGRLRFPDHHEFRLSDLGRIEALMKKHPTALVATTEKDARRLEALGGMSQELKTRLFYIPIEAEFLTDVEKECLLQSLPQ